MVAYRRIPTNSTALARGGDPAEPGDDSDRAPVVRRSSRISLNYAQAQQLVEFFGDEDGDVTIQVFEGGHAGPGLYVWCEDHPEEGASRLDPDREPNQTAARAFPDELSTELLSVLGRPNFWCAPYAALMRANGAEIPMQSEAEQAHVLHWLVKLVLTHGDQWLSAADAELQVMHEKARAIKTGSAS